MRCQSRLHKVKFLLLIHQIFHEFDQGATLKVNTTKTESLEDVQWAPHQGRPALQWCSSSAATNGRCWRCHPWWSCSAFAWHHAESTTAKREKLNMEVAVMNVSHTCTHTMHMHTLHTHTYTTHTRIHYTHIPTTHRYTHYTLHKHTHCTPPHYTPHAYK